MHIGLDKHVPVQNYFPTTSDLTSSGFVQRELHEHAARLTRRQFGREVFVRGVVEVSNFCRENCSYCGMRRANRDLKRFRARGEQVADLLIHHRPGSITDINIQGGEDPVAVREIALPLIRALRRETPLGISVCLGTLTPELYAELQSAGASIYIIKFEIGDAGQYEKLEAPGTLSERLRHIRFLAEHGWFVSSGWIAGLPGEAPSGLLRDLELARALPLRGCSVSPFIPGDATPLAERPLAGADLTLNCMAAMRLARPDWVIPAVSSLNLAGQDGYRRGLCAGANLATINLTPGEVRGDYVIYKRDRIIMTEERVLAAIAEAGLGPSKRGLVEVWQSCHGRPAAPASVPVAE